MDDKTIRAASGRSTDDINLDTLDDLNQEDLQIRGETLHHQAEVARQAGYTQLADNLQRAAELTHVPNDILLNMYESLRPRRSTYDELMQVADLLATTYAAPITAGFVREAAESYQKRGLLR
jgi:propanediol dehydratase small subunit